jgi:hypothetical protein
MHAQAEQCDLPRTGADTNSFHSSVGAAYRGIGPLGDIWRTYAHMRQPMQKIAIAVRDAELFLMATVVRSAATDVYVNWPRDHVVEWKPHTSYHASGQHHQKSFGKALDVRKEQKPGVTFKGTRTVVSFGLASGEHTAVNVRCAPKDFGAVFEIPIAIVRPEKYSTWVYVDLVEPGVDPLLFPGAMVLKQEAYKDAEPWIVLTFFEIPI